MGRNIRGGGITVGCSPAPCLLCICIHKMFLHIFECKKGNICSMLECFNIVIFWHQHSPLYSTWNVFLDPSDDTLLLISKSCVWRIFQLCHVHVQSYNQKFRTLIIHPLALIKLYFWKFQWMFGVGVSRSVWGNAGRAVSTPRWMHSVAYCVGFTRQSLCWEHCQPAAWQWRCRTKDGLQFTTWPQEVDDYVEWNYIVSDTTCWLVCHFA